MLTFLYQNNNKDKSYVILAIFNSILIGQRTVVKPLCLPVVMTCKVVVGFSVVGDTVVVGISVEISNSVVGISVVAKAAVEDTSLVVL